MIGNSLLGNGLLGDGGGEVNTKAPEVSVQQIAYISDAPEVSVQQIALVQDAPEVPATQESVGRSWNPQIWVTQVAIVQAAPEISVQQIGEYVNAAPEVSVAQVAYQTAAPEVAVEQQAYGSFTDSTGVRWRPIVIVGGADLSGRITGRIQIDAEEGAARVADLTLIPSTGAVTPSAYVRQRVTVDVARVDASGTELWRARRFTGRVDVPRYDPRSGQLVLRCTDGLQNLADRAPRAAIDLVASGTYWSAHVFREDANGWQYLQDRMSTRPASLDLGPAGWPRVTDWAASGSPDHTTTAPVHGSVRVELAHAKNMVNRAEIALDFRYTRLRQRDQSYRFELPVGGWCEYLTDPFILPTRGMIRSAVESSDWALQGDISWIELPEPDVFYCGQSTGGAATTATVWGYQPVGGVDRRDSDLDLLCRGAHWKLSKRWAQDVTEEYSIVVTAPQSVSQIGEVSVEESHGVAAEYADAAWEFETNFDGAPAGAALMTNGDSYVDQDQATADGRTEMQAVQRLLIARARTEILAAHRFNRVSWTIPWSPDLDLIHTARLETTRVTAQGKVARVVDRLDTDRGGAFTEVEIAVSRHEGSGSVVEPLYEPADRPETDTTSSPTEVVVGLGSGGNVPTHFGGTVGAPPFDETWDGFTTNYEYDEDSVDYSADPPADVQTVTYPVTFRVATPEISADDRAHTEAPIERTYRVAIPQDDLTLAA